MIKKKSSYHVYKHAYTFSSNGIDNIFKVKIKEAVINRLKDVSISKQQKSSPTFLQLPRFQSIFSTNRNLWRLYFFVYKRKKNIEDRYKTYHTLNVHKLYQIQKL